MISQNPSSTNAYLIEPLLFLRQLDAMDIRYVIGSDLCALNFFSLLPSRLKNNITFVGSSDVPGFEGRPIISPRRFLSEAQSGEPVIYAMDDQSLLGLLVTCGQRRIINASEFSRSHLQSVSQAGHASPAKAVVSSIPRSGSHRVCYFLYALNELIRNPSRVPSAYKLYLYSRHDSSATSSKYYPAEACEFLGIDGWHFGHFVPPGSLATLDHTSIIERIYTPRLTSYMAACAANPGLNGVSLAEPASFEPILSFRHRYRVRYVLLVRDLLEQICSILTILELIGLSAKTDKQLPRSLESYVDYFRAELIPPPFCRFEGQLSLILWKAVSGGRRTTDVVFEDGHIDSLVRDYAWQLYAARHYQKKGSSPGTSARVFQYSDMIADEPRFFQELVSFFRGTELRPDQRVLVDQARHVTRAAAGIEETLGHSLSYDEFERTPFSAKSHQIGKLDGGPRIRAEVQSQVHARGGGIRKSLADILLELENGESVSGAI